MVNKSVRTVLRKTKINVQVVSSRLYLVMFNAAAYRRVVYTYHIYVYIEGLNFQVTFACTISYLFVLSYALILLVVIDRRTVILLCSTNESPSRRSLLLSLLLLLLLLFLSLMVVTVVMWCFRLYLVPCRYLYARCVHVLLRTVTHSFAGRWDGGIVDPRWCPPHRHPSGSPGQRLHVSDEKTINDLWYNTTFPLGLCSTAKPLKSKRVVNGVL